MIIGMSRTRSTLIAAAALLLALTGCAAPQSEPTPTPTPPPAAAEEPGSSPEQWASLIAQQSAEWEDWKTTWDENRCSSLEANLEYAILCRAQFVSATFLTQTTVIEHQLAITPGKSGYIDNFPPSEVKDLFAATKAAAIKAETAGIQWDNGGCVDAPVDGCGPLGFDFEYAIDDLLSQFEAWRPWM